MRPVFFVGYMGSGKSTLGRLLTRETGIEFIDLDSYIENRYHRSIGQLFSERGEEGFREIEREMLHEVSEMQDVVIACGGGTPCFFDNMDYMNKSGTTIWLTAPISILHSRLMRGRHKRPLIATMDSEQLWDFISVSLKKREPYYSKAKDHFDTALLETESDREETAHRFIKQFMPSYGKSRNSDS